MNKNITVQIHQIQSLRTPRNLKVEAVLNPAAVRTLRNLKNLNPNKNVKKCVVKTREYKIPRCKKCTSHKKCSFCLKKFPSQKDLNDHTSIDHDNYHFLCKHHKCGKSFVSDAGLKRHELQHSSMDYKCTVCNRICI